METKLPLFTRISLALVIPGLIFTPVTFASLDAYDGVVASDHADGAGSLPYAAALTEAAVFDGLNASPFDFGSLTGPATIELIIEGDPDLGGQNGYIGQGANTGNSLRFEQWNDTGTVGFTRSGVADYDLGVPSPTTPTHLAYRWDGADTMELFVDGVLSGTISGATFEMPSGAGLIGNVSDGGGEGMLGTIHRITTYDSALADGDIQRHANSWLSTGDPSIQVAGSTELMLDGSMQSFGLTVFNSGATNQLVISMVEIGGVDAAKFSIDTVFPLTIDPGEQDTIAFSFDPAGATGTIAADFTVFSNDLLNDEAVVQLTGLIRDPQISVGTEIDFGVTDVAVTQMLEVMNLGATQALNLTGVVITGADAAKFGVTGPTSIAAGGSGNLDITFTPAGEVGVFTAQLELTTDDPGMPMAVVALRAIEPLTGGFLEAYDGVISADHGGGTGSIPYTSILSVPSIFDGNNSEPFDFGLITGDATFEFILEGDPVAGGRDGFLGVGDVPANSLRYEQWDDTGVLGFTTGGVADYVFDPLGDATLLESPIAPTHIAYLWESGAQTMSMFIDGDLAGTNVGANFVMPSGVGFLGNNAGGTEGMIGTIHRATIYDNALAADDVKRHALAFSTGAGGAPFEFIAVSNDDDTGMVTIEWNSISNAIYAVDRSYDLAEWEELDDGILGEGETTEYMAPADLPEGGGRVYFRVRQL